MKSLDKLSMYIPQGKMERRIVERLAAIAKDRERSLNFLMVEAVEQYLGREEAK